MSDGSDNFIIVAAGLAGAFLGALGTIIGSLLSRQPALATMVDARIRVLFDGYQNQIQQLTDEVIRLKAEVETLTNLLTEYQSKK